MSAVKKFEYDLPISEAVFSVVFVFMEAINVSFGIRRWIILRTKFLQNFRIWLQYMKYISAWAEISFNVLVVMRFFNVAGRTWRNLPSCRRFVCRIHKSCVPHAPNCVPSRMRFVTLCVGYPCLRRNNTQWGSRLACLHYNNMYTSYIQ